MLLSVVLGGACHFLLVLLFVVAVSDGVHRKWGPKYAGQDVS